MPDDPAVLWALYHDEAAEREPWTRTPKPPFTAAERVYIQSQIDRWMCTGYGIDPNQLAFRHYPDDEHCGCHQCAGTPIETRYAPSAYYGQINRLREEEREAQG